MSDEAEWKPLTETPRKPREYIIPPRGYRDLIPFMMLPIYSPSARCKGRCYMSLETSFSKYGMYVSVRPNDYKSAIATIADADIMIFAISMLMAARNSHTPAGATITFEPRALLAAIGRTSTEARIANLRGSLKRLHNTHVLCRDRDMKPHHRLPDFESTLITDFDCPVRRDGAGQLGKQEDRPKWSLTLADWIYKRVMLDETPPVRLIDPALFKLRKYPLERFMGRLATVNYRYDEAEGYALIPFQHILDRSGSKMEWSKFARSLMNVVDRNRLPDHTLSYIDHERLGPCVVVRPRGGKPPASKPRRSDPSRGPGGSGGAVARRPVDPVEVIDLDDAEGSITV